MANRKYCKKILASCNIYDQTDINICIVSRALSLRDNYWIKHADSFETWEKVNLYKNLFSTDIAYTALTGEGCSVPIGDKLYTGELTNKGTRAKCYFRQNNDIFLAKAESEKEIISEIISHEIATKMFLPSAKYINTNLYGKNCVVCKINTSKDVEMIHCRDILTDYGCEMNWDSAYYKEFFERDADNFLTMQVFDYLTLNTDRNRDNFALRQINGKATGLYPIYDHDSCFTGKSEDAFYFVTGLSFKNTLELLKKQYTCQYNKVLPKLKNLHTFVSSAQGKELFEKYHLENQYGGFVERIEKALII